jgi:hypothetical protein
MENPTTNGIISQLEADRPHWEVWVVHRYIGGDLWCARRRDNHHRLLHADTSDQLAEYLEDACSR